MTLRRALKTFATEGLTEQYQGRGVFGRSADGGCDQRPPLDLRSIADQFVTAQQAIERLPMLSETTGAWKRDDQGKR